MGQIFRQAEQYLDRLDKGVFVEIGTARDGDDDSTHTLRSWANRLGKTFYTVDIDPRWTERAKMLYYDNLVAVNSSGEDFLTKFSRGTEFISLLYLDNFDWQYVPEGNACTFQINQYKDRWQLEMDNAASQLEHLKQFLLLESYLTQNAVVACDDTYIERGVWTGKCGPVVVYMLAKGWKLRDRECGALLTR